MIDGLYEWRMQWEWGACNHMWNVNTWCTRKMVWSIITSSLKMISTTKYCDNQQRMVMTLIMLHDGQRVRWCHYIKVQCPTIITAQADQCWRIVVLADRRSVCLSSYHCSIDRSLERQAGLCRSAPFTHVRDVQPSADKRHYITSLYRSTSLIISLQRSHLSLLQIADQWLVAPDNKYIINRYNTIACLRSYCIDW